MCALAGNVHHHHVLHFHRCVDCSVGGAAFCLDYAWRYASERQQFGQPIGSFQASQFKLADMATNLEASRVMVRGAAAALDSQSSRATLAAAMAKRFATDTCFGVANDALQLLGGYGYLQVSLGAMSDGGSGDRCTFDTGHISLCIHGWAACESRARRSLWSATVFSARCGLQRLHVSDTQPVF